jgi:hypothetical protein
MVPRTEKGAGKGISPRIRGNSPPRADAIGAEPLWQRAGGSIPLAGFSKF